MSNSNHNNEDNFNTNNNDAYMTLRDVGLLGHDEARDLVPIVLSRAFCESKRAPANGLSCQLSIALELYARERVRIADRTFPAYDPSFQAKVRPRGIKRIMDGLGKHDVDTKVLREGWEDAKRAQELQAQISETLLAEIFPVEYWPLIVEFMSDGPRVAGMKMTAALRTYSQRTVRTRRNSLGSDQRIAENTLKTVRRAARRLAKVLAELSVAFPALRPWREDMAIEIPADAPKITLSSDSPPPHLVRAGWSRLRGDLCARLGCELGDELDAVANASDHRIQENGLLRVSRNWAFFTTLVCTAGRIGAIAELKQGSFTPTYTTSDYSGPALLMEPKKTWQDGEISVKMLGDAGYPILVYLAILNRSRELSELELGPLSAEDPLFVSEVGGRAWSRSGMSLWLVGNEKMRPPVGKPDNPEHGFSGHKFRATSFQWLDSLAAKDVLARRRIDVQPHFLAHAAADHTLGSLTATYSKVRATRAFYSRVAIDILYRLLTTPEGARRVPDVEGYRAAKLAERALEGEQRKANAAMAALDHDDPRAVTTAIALLNEQQTVAEELAQWRLKIERIEANDPATFVAISDLDDRTYDDDPDWEQVKSDALAGLGSAGSTTARPVRDWVTVSEFAEVAGKSPKQIRNWLAGVGLPGGNAAPWSGGFVPVETVGKRRRRIIVAGIDPAYLAADPARSSKLAALQSAWPADWTKKYRQAKAKRPAWMKGTR